MIKRNLRGYQKISTVLKGSQWRLRRSQEVPVGLKGSQGFKNASEDARDVPVDLRGFLASFRGVTEVFLEVLNGLSSVT